MSRGGAKRPFMLIRSYLHGDRLLSSLSTLSSNTRMSSSSKLDSLERIFGLLVIALRSCLDGPSTRSMSCGWNLSYEIRCSAV